MDDNRIWTMERDLWVGEGGVYRDLVDPEVVMVVPAEPHVLHGEAAIRAVEATPRWREVDFSETTVARPQEGLIVIGYRVRATRDDEAFEAWCSSVYRRLAHDEWRVVQHGQTPHLAAGAD